VYKVRVLQNRLHPEEIAEGEQGAGYEIMKDRKILGEINELVLLKRANEL
jgi:hypothetical protein